MNRFHKNGCFGYGKTNFSSKCPIKRLANDGASFVPITVPPTCRNSLLSNSKLFVLILVLGGGKSNDSTGLTKRFSARMPSSFGILVYRLVTSKVSKMAPGVIYKCLMILYIIIIMFY